MALGTGYRIRRTSAMLAWACMCSLGCTSLQGAEAATRLPEGPTGLAAGYPGDAGIAADPDVVFAEDFESGSIEQVKAHWEESGGRMELAADVPAGSAGRASVLMTHVGGEGTGSSLWRRIANKSGGYGYARLFLRTYVKFDADCFPLHHFGCNLGGRNPVGPKWPMGNAGLRPQGDDRFNSGPETRGKAWQWDWYNYWMEMRSWENPDGSTKHPPSGNGQSFYGNDFFGTLAPPVERAKWICVEFMIQLNTPGQHDGEMALWIDGRLVRGGGQVIGHLGAGFPNGHWIRDNFMPGANEKPFEGMAWRNHADLLINNMSTMVYITKAPAGHVSKVWFDDLVLATKYIGPLQAPGQPLSAAVKPEAAGVHSKLQPRAVTVDAEPHRAKLRAALQEPQTAYPVKVFLDVLGQKAWVQVAGADSRGVQVRYKGNVLPLAWAEVGDSELARLTLDGRAHDAEALFQAALLAAANRDQNLIERLKERLAQVDGGRLKALDAQLKEGAQR